MVKLYRAVLAATWVLWGTLHMGFGAPVIAATSPLKWVEITSANDPQFVTKAQQAMLGNASSALVGSVLPYSVIVSNNGTIPIIGVDVRFKLTVAGQAVHKKNFFYHSFPTGSNVLLPPGTTLLFTPLKTANAIAGGAPVAGRGGSGGATTSAADSWALQQLASSDRIDISLDLVVAADGRMAGPDEARTVKQLTQQRNAYADLRNELLDRLTKGVSDAEIQTWLTPMSQQRVVRDPETNWGDRYTAEQKALASSWNSAIASGRRSNLQIELTKMTPDLAFPIVSSLKGGLQ